MKKESPKKKNIVYYAEGHLIITTAKPYKSCFKCNESRRSALANVGVTFLPRSLEESV
jgi:hypothetical protein